MLKKLRKTTMIAAVIGGMTTGAFAQDSELDKKIERIVEQKLQERLESQDDIFGKANTGLAGVEIHGHLQFEHENYGSDGSRSGDSTFDNQYYTLWIGHQINDYLEASIELEYEHTGTDGLSGGTGGGGTGKREIDQASATWSPLKDKTFQMRFGRFYAPFGIERFQYAGPANRLVSRPPTMRNVVPGTFSTVGVEVLGENSISDNVKFKYEVAVVNGLGPDAAVDIGDARQSRDNNDNKAVVGRVAFNITSSAGEFEIGTSYYDGKYNEFQVNGHSLTPDNELNLTYNAADFSWKTGNNELRGEVVDSAVDTGETLISASRNFRRQGYYVQNAYRFEFDKPILKHLDLVARFDSKDENTTVKNTADTNSWAFGVIWGVYDNMRFKLERLMVHERGPTKLSNDAWLAQVSINF